MRSFSIGSSCKFIALALTAVLLGACHRGGSKPDTVPNANIPAGFDLTLIADKDTQFDLDGAPLTTEDLKSALRYRQEEALPMATILLKRGEKEKIKNEHIIALARIAYQMKFRAFIEEKDEISEIKAELKEADASPSKQAPAANDVPPSR
ncbi:MAG: hypothetical protein ABIR62_06240 [Dokdonella sp.]|uniref:hypothetical protein n=1 Tax=Dokdonella sp. TaxID=2291710 RepID=UPI00326424C5